MSLGRWTRDFGRGARVGATWELMRVVARPLALAQHLIVPVLLLAVLGGFGQSGTETAGAAQRAAFIYTGVFSFAVLGVAANAGAGVVGDAERGLLATFVVSPVSMSGLLLGRTLGISFATMAQAGVLLALAPLSGLALTVGVVAQLIPLLVTFSVALAGLGLFTAARSDHPTRSMLLQYVPMALILSAGVFVHPGANASWLDRVTILNPVSYVVDAIRQVLLSSPDTQPLRTSLALVVGDHRLRIWEDVVLAIALGVPLVVFGVRRVRSLVAA